MSDSKRLMLPVILCDSRWIISLYKGSMTWSCQQTGVCRVYVGFEENKKEGAASAPIFSSSIVLPFVLLQRL